MDALAFAQRLAEKLLLEKFIANSQDKREVERAMVVKMLLCRYKPEAIIALLVD